MNYLELLAGDPDVFVTEHWGRRPLIHQAEPGVLAQIFGIEQADELLTTSALRTPQVRLAKNGKVLDQASYTRKATIANQPMTGLLDVRKVLDLFEGGATIVFQGLQRYWEPLRQLVRGLEQELGHPCQANAYLTPPGSQGFALHRDTHDVFTFQTHGAKDWEIHYDGAPHEVAMRPGTSMYLPTGTPHMARTGADEASLHVTVGINRVVWAEVLREVALKAIDGDTSLNEPLPARAFSDPDALAAALRARLGELAGTLQGFDADAEVDRMERRFGTGRQPVLSGGLLDVLDVRHLADDTRLRRRTGAQATLRPRGDEVELLLGDRRLALPGRVQPVLQALLDADEFTPAELPGIASDSALVLCRRLVREGLLEVVR